MVTYKDSNIVNYRVSNSAGFGHVSVSENNPISCNNPVINTTISTIGHGFKLKITPFRLDKKKICNRVISTWNILPERIVNLTPKTQFKKALRSANFESATKFDRHL